MDKSIKALKNLIDYIIDMVNKRIVHQKKIVVPSVELENRSFKESYSP